MECGDGCCISIGTSLCGLVVVAVVVVEQEELGFIIFYNSNAIPQEINKLCCGVLCTA